MKLLVIFLALTSLSAFSMDGRKDYVDQYKKYNKKIEEQIDDLDKITHCDQEPDDDKMVECVKQSLNSLKNVDIKKIEEVLELKTHGLVKSGNKKEVVGFLVSELEKRIHNKKKITKRNQQKYIDHTTHFDMHRSRLSKSLLLEISNFCRERVHIDTSCIQTGCSPGTDKFYMTQKSQDELDKELEYLGKGSVGETGNLAGDLYQFCLGNINGLCKHYQTSRDSAYADACLFKKRVANYKKTIERTTKIRNELSKHRVGKKGFDIGQTAAYSGLFNPNRKELDKITNITSGSLNKREVKDLKADADQVAQVCQEGKSSPECQKYINLLSEEEVNDIQREVKKKYAIKEAYLQGITDEEKLKEFAAKYLRQKDLETVDIRKELKDEFDAEKAAIIASIKEQVKGHKGTTLGSVVEKENDKNKFELNAGDDKKIAQDIEEKSNPNAIRDNIFYSNLVNSYLTREMTVGNTTQTSRNFSLGVAEFDSSASAQDDGSAYFQHRQSAEQAFKQAQQGSGSREVASEIEGDISQGLGQIFNLIIFGDAENKK